MELLVYLAGQIHDDWRQELMGKVKDLPLHFVGPETDHKTSDEIGERILGNQPNAMYKDLQAARINQFKTRLLLDKADLVIGLFGEDYRQWNTAMDVATAIEKGKPTIIIRPEALTHALKEVSAKADVTVENIDQAIEVLKYTLRSY